MIEFKPASEAKRENGSQILGDFGGAWLSLAAWSDTEKEWVCAELQASMYQGKPDYYYETAFEKHENLKRWLPVPENR
jgi:hypothetical protein